MKRFIFSAVVLLVCAASAAAQTTSSTPSPSVSLSIREEIKNARQEIINTRQETKIKIDAQRALLQQKLKQIKDQVKQNTVLRISDRLTALNNLMVDHFLAVLTRLDTILNNIGSRVDKAQSAGLDVAAVRTAISDAQKAISASRNAVKVQAGKTYPITIITTANATTTENNLKVDVGKARQVLHADLVAVRATVVAARDAVHKAATTLVQIQGIDDIDKENPSGSPSPTPSASASPSASPSPSDND